ncbi:Strobilurin A biosynthesis cluster protein l1 [Psilocybe cubensis]|uniref:Uncharacterized protein n=2 Tax=Psilocybe cubensis TaxID=181762 RepID=A0A8H7Y734_PSICU|nr:Strobilurin A biosynthesis cluster protein l1 [Psilocybe cubensis]KAH9484955.1 Strobilurin A biosynthesis cluster protein l1 [Psilocybe cubensis]
MPATITINWRAVKRITLFLVCVTLPVLYYLYYTFKPPVALYAELFDAELKASKTVAETRGKDRYVKFKQLQGAGFNNQAQEILLYHHLALQTSRTYVYQPLIWRPRGEKATVPLSAFLLGVTENSISEAVFEQVCPPGEVVHVNLRVDYADQWFHAKDILNRKDRCVVVDDWLFNWNFLASTGLRVVWSSFQTYLADHFKWSEHVLDIVNRTEANLGLRPNSSASADGEPYMAIHLRRGDFEDHCSYLAETRQGFTTWATLPLIQQTIYSPTLDTYNATSVMAHCYPSLYRILDVISDQARKKPHLRRLHVLHDGSWDHPLVYLQFYKLAEALKSAEWAKRHGWEGGPMLRVTQSSDAPIYAGERDWTVCVDVELARRAEVFIGNGYSSLSTQVIALRLADGGNIQDITLV